MPRRSSQDSAPPIQKVEETQVEMGFMDLIEASAPPSLSLSALENEVAQTGPRIPSEEESPLPSPGGAQVKLQLFGRPDDDLAQLGRSHFEKMENNPHFPRPLPSQMELEKLLEDFTQDCKDTRNAMNHVRMLVAQKLKSRRKLEQALNRRGHYVQAESRGDPAAILSSAFSIRRQRQAVASLAAPADLRVTPGTEPGSVILTWAKVGQAKLYRLEYGPTDGPKTEIPLTGRRRKQLAGLEIGRMHSFRIASIGGMTGQSPWSEVVKRMVA
jgi:hypothetical protein